MKKILYAVLLSLATGTLFAQSIAIADINTYKVDANPQSAATLVRLELFKIGKYSILDKFDMMEIADPAEYEGCYAKDCLVKFGRELSVDFMMSGSIDKISDKIVVSLKLIDVKKGELVKTSSHEFDDQEAELQRMVGIVVRKMHDIESNPELVKRLSYKNEVITSNNYTRIKNSGPRIGMAYAYGSLNEFMTRSESRGGLDIIPVISTLGYQFEVQYVGTENFSALFEFIPMFLGLEQGKFIPTVAVLNGFRFGKAGWEIAFGPSFGLSKQSYGFFDTDAQYGNADMYWTTNDLELDGYSANSYQEYGYHLEPNMDARGKTILSTRWIIAFGRTFRSGALNVPVNIFHSSQKNGGMVGLSIGFNITRVKK